MKKTVYLLVSSLHILCASSALCADQSIPPNHPKFDLPQQTTTHEKTTTISGKVLESTNSGGYSYIHLLKTSGEKIWIAVKETKITTGEQMSFREGLVMTKFESKTLKRTFDSIIFSNGIIPQTKSDSTKAAPKNLSVPVMPSSSDTKNQPKVVLGSKSAVTSKEKISVTKASGLNAYTVAETYKKSAQLDKKTVTVRGKVVKASTGIMKRTWLHIQDGTGFQAKGTHNLVCTTKGTANVGDVITVSGTLAKDRDFGSGYKYNVIIEDATVSIK
jgi:hypothetical protein